MGTFSLPYLERVLFGSKCPGALALTIFLPTCFVNFLSLRSSRGYVADNSVGVGHLTATYS